MSAYAGSVSDSKLRPVGAKAAMPSAGKQTSTQLRVADQKGKLSSTAMPFPMGNPYMAMNPFFPARSLFPMMPFGPTLLPGMVPAAAGKGASTSAGASSNSKTSSPQQMPVMPPMMPMMPACFPHPAQLQAMSAAAQAAMAQASKTGMPFPPGMMMPPFMFPMQQMSVQQPQAAMPAATGQLAQAGSSRPASTAAAAVAGGDCTAEDDDVDCVDEQIEVDAETEQLFEKVAAMEREKCAAATQAVRADSPCPSIHSASTRDASCHPCSPTHTTAGGNSSSAPVSAAVFEEAASLPPAAVGTAAEETVPVPWLTFAADDGVDDIDDDLAQLITLPEAKPASAPAAAGRTAPSSGNLDAAATAMKRVASADSAFSSGDALIGSVPAAVLGTPAGATAALGGQKSATAIKPKGKLIKIKTTKGPTSTAAGTKNINSKASKPTKYPASRASNKLSTAAAAAGLGTAKSGVQKKSNTSKASKAKPPVPAAPKAAVTQQQQACEDACLSILDELHSGLSDTCFGASSDDMGIDSFEYLGGLLQEASGEDAWDGLLAGAGDDMELCSALQA